MLLLESGSTALRADSDGMHFSVKAGSLPGQSGKIRQDGAIIVGDMRPKKNDAARVHFLATAVTKWNGETARAGILYAGATI